MAYIQNSRSDQECVFCSALTGSDDSGNLVVHRGNKAFVILNRYPYTSGHLMIVPNAHQPSLVNLDAATRSEIMELAVLATGALQTVYHPEGFNLGFNIGEAGGAGIVEHIHMHVVPRWNGDTNFMSSLGMTRVLPEALEDTYQRMKAAWANLH